MSKCAKSAGTVLLLALALTMGSAGLAAAKGGFTSPFSTKYGYTISCAYCHPNNDTSRFNSYAVDYRAAYNANGKNATTAYTAVEPLDSDRDGFTNIDEIVAKTLPYDAASFPVVVGPVCTDNDGDGFSVEGGACGPVDCNDSDAAIYPGAVENCSDGIDNNCNGLIDGADPGADGCSSDQKRPSRAGIFRDGKWYFDGNGNCRWDSGSDIAMGTFGRPGDIPVTGDWNGDGFAQIGVYRNGKWYLDANGNGLWDSGVDTVVGPFGGLPEDIPVTGDWNGDGKTQIGVYRNGKWYLDANGNGIWDSGTDTTVSRFGLAGDIPVTGDWSGDGKTRIGVYRNGSWYLDANGNGFWDSGTDTLVSRFGGVAGDMPATGDWSGDGKTQIGVYRNGSWYLDANGNGFWDGGVDISGNFGGAPTDIPVKVW